MTDATPTTSNGATEAMGDSGRHLRPAPTTEAARLVRLSPSTLAVVSKAGVTFIRGNSAFILAKSEYRKLVAVGEGT